MKSVLCCVDNEPAPNLHWLGSRHVAEGVETKLRSKVTGTNAGELHNRSGGHGERYGQDTSFNHVYVDRTVLGWSGSTITILGGLSANRKVPGELKVPASGSFARSQNIGLPCSLEFVPTVNRLNQSAREEQRWRESRQPLPLHRRSE
jgi:hypothetical protein